MSKIFLAFPTYQVNLKSKFKILDSFEFWNLDKIDVEQFIKLIQSRIKLVNENVKNNYFSGKSIDDFKSVYNQSNWGILLPSHIKDNYYMGEESMFLLNLYSDIFLKPVFCVNKLGAHCFEPISIATKSLYHNHDKVFTNTRFIKYYKLLMPEIVNINWHADKVSKWTKENWRMYVIGILFNNLEKYQGAKSVIIWQKECADLVNFYETLLSRSKNDGGKYKIIQRLEVLLSGYYKEDFIKVKKGLNRLFDYRNEFIHGSFLSRLENETRKKIKSGDNNLMTGIEFDFLKNQTLLARKVLISFLYIKKRNKRMINRSVPDIINDAIMDIKLRVKIEKNVKEILDLTKN